MNIGRLSAVFDATGSPRSRLGFAAIVAVVAVAGLVSAGELARLHRVRLAPADAAPAPPVEPNHEQGAAYRLDHRTVVATDRTDAEPDMTGASIAAYKF
jgi:hypothetical protein